MFTEYEQVISILPSYSMKWWRNLESYHGKVIRSGEHWNTVGGTKSQWEVSYGEIFFPKLRHRIIIIKNQAVIEFLSLKVETVDGHSGARGQVVLRHAQTEVPWMLPSKPDPELARARPLPLAGTIVEEDLRMSNFATRKNPVVSI